MLMMLLATELADADDAQAIEACEAEAHDARWHFGAALVIPACS